MLCENLATPFLFIHSVSPLIALSLGITHSCLERRSEYLKISQDYAASDETLEDSGGFNLILVKAYYRNGRTIRVLSLPIKT